MARDAILLTPGPLTTTERTKRAMLHDWGSWDASFIAVTAEIRKRLLKPAGDNDVLARHKPQLPHAGLDVALLRTTIIEV